KYTRRIGAAAAMAASAATSGRARIGADGLIGWARTLPHRHPLPGSGAVHECVLDPRPSPGSLPARWADRRSPNGRDPTQAAAFLDNVPRASRHAGCSACQQVTVASLVNGYDPGGFFDEMFEASGAPRAHYRKIHARLETMGRAELDERRRAADLSFLLQ